MATYRVLALDGGGIRGLVTAIILRRLCEQFPRFLDDVDLIAGTSSGGMIALALADGLGCRTTLETLQKICWVFEQGKTTFGRPTLWKLWWAGHLVFRKYGADSRRGRFKEQFGERQLKDLKRHVLIAAFDLDGETTRLNASGKKKIVRTWKPKLFHNIPEAPGRSGDPSDRNDGCALAWEVAMATSAAPTLFPTFEGYVDGGVYSNNPSMCALAQLLDERYQPMAGRRYDGEPEKSNPDLDDIVLLSIGSGLSLKYLPAGAYPWGLAQWILPFRCAGNLAKLVGDGTVGIADYQCRRLLRDRYHRIEPTFDDGIDIGVDDLKYLPLLKHLAEQTAFPAKDFIQPADITWLRTRWMAPALQPVLPPVPPLPVPPQPAVIANAAQAAQGNE